MALEGLQINPSLRRYTPLRGFAVSRDDLLKLYRLLQQLADEAGEKEVATFTLGEGQTQKNLQKSIDAAKSLFKVVVKIETEKQDILSQSSEEIFKNPDFPENISRIEFDTGSAFSDHVKLEPKHRIYFLLDFRKYGEAGVGTQPAQATPNDSGFTVVGEDSNWVHAAKSRIDNFFDTKKNEKRMWIHKEGIYDYLLIFVGTIFIAWTMSKSVPVIDDWLTVKGKIYVYGGYLFVFLFSLRFFLFMFNYVRFIWPVMELTGVTNVSKIHRGIWATISLGIIAAVIKDLFF